MTFIPQVLTKDDPNNSGQVGSNVTNFVGTSTDVSGYNSLIISITNAGTIGTLQVQFSSDNVTFTTYYTDTVTSGNYYVKTYPILKQYYAIYYGRVNDNSTPSILSRLSTQIYSSENVNSISAFENSLEGPVDSFGKSRVTFPYNILELKIPGQDASGLGTTGSTAYVSNYLQICSKGTTGAIGATASAVSSNSKCVITAIGRAKFTNQSRKYCVYQPGKSLLIYLTGVIGYTGSGATGFYSRFGYFDDYNGLFFEYGPTGIMTVNLRAGNTTTSYTQDNWNIDKMNGSGSSGLNLNWLKTQLFVIDAQWLGVGRIRFGFYVFGKVQYCHQILNTNSLTAPFTPNINLPVRYELDGLTGGTGDANITQICATVISEGGYNPVGRPFSISTSTSGITGTNTVALMLRGGNTYGNFYHQNILPINLSLLSNSNNDITYYKLMLYFAGATITGATWNNVNPLSVCEYSRAGTITEGVYGSIIIDEGYLQGRVTSIYENLSETFTNLLQITSNIDNVSDILVLYVSRATGSNPLTVYSSIQWEEIY